MAGKQVTYILNLKSNISEGLNKASESVKGFEGKIAGVGAKTQSVFGGMMKYNIISTLATGALSLGKSMVTMASDMETSKVAFEVLLGSGEKAKAMLGDMKKFADKTPFEFKDLQQAGKTMLGFQIPANKIMSTLKNLGDVSMGDSDKLQSMTLAFSQMSATGRLMGQDLNQMINAGFNPLGEMARTSGKSVAYFKDQMSKGAISSQMVADAFASATAKGGPFFGMMDKMSQSTAGRFSTLMDQIHTIGTSIGSAVLPYLNKLMEGVSYFFSRLGEIRNALQPIFDIMINTFKSVSDSISNLFQGADTSMNGFIDTIKLLVAWIQPLIESIGEIIGFVWKTLTDILKPLIPFFEMLMGIMHGLFIVIKYVIKAIMVALQPVIWMIKQIAHWIGFVSRLLMGAWKVMTKLISKFMELEWVKALFSSISDSIKWIGDGLTWLYDNTLGPIIDNIMAAVNAIERALGISEESKAKTYSKEEIDDLLTKGVADRDSKEAKTITTMVNWAFKNRRAKGSNEIILAANAAGWFDKGDTGATGATGRMGNFKAATSPSTVKSNSPNNINISINSLVEEFTISTTNLKESNYQIKELITKVLIDAVNDVNLVR